MKWRNRSNSFIQIIGANRMLRIPPVMADYCGFKAGNKLSVRKRGRSVLFERKMSERRGDPRRLRIVGAKFANRKFSGFDPVAFVLAEIRRLMVVRTLPQTWRMR